MGRKSYLGNRDKKKPFFYRNFRKSVAVRQARLAICCCAISLLCTAVFVPGRFLFHAFEFVEKGHLLMLYIPSGIVAFIILLAIVFLLRQPDKNWRILEALTYITMGCVPYWGLLFMNMSVVENRPINFFLFTVGMLVASTAIYMHPHFSTINMIGVNICTYISLERFDYSMGDLGVFNLICISVISVWASILRFQDGYSGYINNEELEIAVKAAEQANAAKGKFLAHMSHEIRTPINAVLGMNELILRESKDTDITTYATHIKDAGTMLLSLVNDILDFSKIEAGKLEIAESSYQLSSTLHDLINVVNMRIRDKGLEFHIHVNEHTPANLCGDEIRVKQVIINLLSNAVKYTQMGSVTFSVDFQRLDSDRIELIASVKDTGIGIREEDMGKLTEKFERIEESRNRNIEGTGLGMSIAVELLKLLDGRLEVESRYGEGSCFTVYIPQKVNGESEIGVFGRAYKQSAESLKEYHSAFVAPEARILIVDDNRTNRILAKELLRATDIQVDLAESGFAFLEMIKKKSYHIIFLDHLMPEMDGVEALQRMKQIPNVCGDAVMIALTANAVTGAKEFYLQAGFDDFLSKPIIPFKYENIIKQYLPKDLVQYK